MVECDSKVACADNWGAMIHCNPVDVGFVLDLKLHAIDVDALRLNALHSPATFGTNLVELKSCAYDQLFSDAVKSGLTPVSVRTCRHNDFSFVDCNQLTRLSATPP